VSLKSSGNEFQADGPA